MQKLLSPLFHALPLPVAFLVLLSLDMAFLTYAVMPHYSCLTNFWLRPGEDSTWRTELAGCGIIICVIGLTLLGFLAFDRPS